MTDRLLQHLTADEVHIIEKWCNQPSLLLAWPGKNTLRGKLVMAERLPVIVYFYCLMMA